MHRQVKKSGTLLTAQMLGERQDSRSFVGDCFTRKMTSADWEKYGPLNISDSRIMKKNKTIPKEALSHDRP